jgi:hypothetical protein
MGKILLLKTTYLTSLPHHMRESLCSRPGVLRPLNLRDKSMFLAGFQEMPLNDLPNEILLNIVKFACSSHNINSCFQGSRRLHQVINPYLYLQKVITRDSTALFCGDRPGNKVTVRSLEAGAKVSSHSPAFIGEYSDSVLHLAVNTNLNEKFVRLLLERGADIERIGLYRDTTLSRAVSSFFENEPLSVIQSLLDHGANIEARGNRENTQLHCAIIFEKLAIAQVPIDSGANINTVNSKEIRPARKSLCKEKMLELLLEKGP